jgi:hypothetical protein
MVVGVAPQHSLREVLIHVGGIGFRLTDHLGAVRRSRVLGQRRAAQYDDERDANGEHTSDHLHGFYSS